MFINKMREKKVEKNQFSWASVSYPQKQTNNTCETISLLTNIRPMMTDLSFVICTVIIHSNQILTFNRHQSGLLKYIQVQQANITN